MNAAAGSGRFSFRCESCAIIGRSASVGCAATTAAETTFGGADGMIDNLVRDYQLESCTSPT